MFHLDTLRLIRKTIKRFLTIFLMVFIGVCFMVGLLTTTPIMHKSVDIYYDEYNFMDVQLYSSYGFDDEDIKAIKDTKNVDDVFATKYVDVHEVEELEKCGCLIYGENRVQAFLDKYEKYQGNGRWDFISVLI